MNNYHDNLDDWEFLIDEISANVYKVRGVDKSGRTIEKIGTNIEQLMNECKVAAIEISKVVQR